LDSISLHSAKKNGNKKTIQNLARWWWYKHSLTHKPIAIALLLSWCETKRSLWASCGYW
jgi:hypothetical protein